MFKIENQFTIQTGTGDLWSVQNSSYLEIKWPSKLDISFTGITFSHHKVSAMGPKSSVLCHAATGSLVSRHGLRKYWHFGFCEVSPTLCIYTKRFKRGGSTGGGSKRIFICFKDNRQKAKEYGASVSSKKYICWLIADLYALQNNSINKTNISFLNHNPIKTKYFLIILSVSNIHPRVDISFFRVATTSQGLNQMYSCPLSEDRQYTTARQYPI